MSRRYPANNVRKVEIDPQLRYEMSNRVRKYCRQNMNIWDLSTDEVEDIVWAANLGVSVYQRYLDESV